MHYHIDRRQFLELAAASAASVAGCSSKSETDGTETTRQQTSQTTAGVEATPTPQPQAQEYTYRAPNGRLYREQDALTFDNVAVGGVSWRAHDSLRYWDDGAGRLKTLTPENDWFLLYSVYAKNMGGSVKRTPNREDFTVHSDAGEFDPQVELPDPVTQNNLRMPIHVEVKPAPLADLHQAGETKGATFLFDVPEAVSPAYTLKWDPGVQIDGSSEPVYLAPAASR